MKLTNVADVTEAIAKLLANPTKDKPNKLMLDALEAVVSQIEAKAKGNESITNAMTKVRQAYGITNDSLNGGTP